MKINAVFAREEKLDNPITMRCTNCEDTFGSKYPGQYVECKCGESAVDQTNYYTRVIGKAVPEENK